MSARRPARAAGHRCAMSGLVSRTSDRLNPAPARQIASGLGGKRRLVARGRRADFILNPGGCVGRDRARTFGKDGSPMEERALKVLGLDVSQSFVDFARSDGAASGRVENEGEGMAQLIEQARNGVDLVVCEATGGYEKLVVA